MPSLMRPAKVLKKIGMQVSKADVEAVVNCEPDAVERVLKLIQAKVRRLIHTLIDNPIHGEGGLLISGTLS